MTSVGGDAGVGVCRVLLKMDLVMTLINDCVDRGFGVIRVKLELVPLSRTSRK